MRTVSPNLQGVEEFLIGENQHEYKTLVGGMGYLEGGGGNIVVLRWKLTPEERQRLIDGEDFWTTHLTFGSPFQPLTADVGKPDWLPPLTE